MLTRDKQLVLFRGVYLATRKRRIGFVTLIGGFAPGSLSPFECLPDQHSPSHYGLFGVALRRVTVAIGL